MMKTTDKTTDKTILNVLLTVCLCIIIALTIGLARINKSKSDTYKQLEASIETNELLLDDNYMLGSVLQQIMKIEEQCRIMPQLGNS